MIRTLTTTEAADLLLRDENAAWSYNGARALVEYLEDYEGNSTPIEFDRVAIRCEFSEYKSALEAARAYGNDYSVSPVDDDDNERPMDEVIAELEAYCLDWLQDNTQVIQFDGGIIIQDY